MKTKVGIVGYGNLGMAVEKELKESDVFELVGVFSKRNVEGTIPVDTIDSYKGKIELLFLCGGSQNELEKQALKLIKNFSIVESYDNHNKLENFHKMLEKKAQRNGRIALCSLGWDPGLFSLMRGLFDAVGYKPFTFWGKGLSQGHTQAIKNIAGVKDAVQFTIPNNNAVKQICKGKDVEISKNFHRRECFVVCERGQRERVKHEIVTMPDYFDGYRTSVKFVTQRHLEKIKNFKHQGKVLTKNKTMEFSLMLPSNPEFTAKVAVCFAAAFENLKKDNKVGVFTIFDVPLSYILRGKKYLYL